ncbi:MAG: HD domain-containing protein [Deltaproteobacteria bacterium]|nr:HD domain-containing protein [Deltaproteobacteria bacterium]
MALNIIRRVRGNLHGSIDISELEDRVIAHPIFQRLRRIRQTAFLSFVFPGASHSRFEHSLGVMHLAAVAWTKLYMNQQRLAQNCQKFRNFTAMERSATGGVVHGVLSPVFSQLEEIFGSDELLQALRLAALLHDIGHPPFSHSGEKFLPSPERLLADAQSIPDYLQEYLRRLSEGRGHRKPVSHEVYTMLLTEKLLTEVYRDAPELSLQIDPRDVISILNPEIRPRPTSLLKTLKVQTLCHELVSGELDIDRMDYLQRDSQECGVVYGIFDADRIMDSLTLYADPDSLELHLAIQFSGLAAFEDYLRARQSMFVQLYFHKTSVACEAMLQHIRRQLPEWSLPSDPDEYWKIDEYNIRQVMQEALESSGSLHGAEDLKVLTDDLFLHRRLWKRVYEVASAEASPSQKESLNKLVQLLKDAGVSSELVSSTNYLTRLRPRKKRENSKNYLKLIKRDDTQLPRVVPVEDYSSLVREGIALHLYRIYTSQQQSDKARQVIMDSFFESGVDG